MSDKILLKVTLPLIVGGLLLGFAGCDRGNGGRRSPAAPKPALGGNEIFQVHGSADDGDDGDGAPGRYRSPRNNSADNQTTASSTPASYRDIAAAVAARPGNNATRLAVSLANTKATSTFTVAGTVTCRLFVSSAGTVSLTSGVGDYLVVARIRDASGRLIRGSDVQGKYEFKENNANYLQNAEIKYTPWIGDPIKLRTNQDGKARSSRHVSTSARPGSLDNKVEIEGSDGTKTVPITV